MSHFCVLVKVSQDKLAQHQGDVREAVESLLAPYQENNMGDCPKELLKFNDCTSEVEEAAQTIIEASDYLGGKHPESIGKTILEHYGNDISKVADQYCGYSIDKETGKYGYWENPNAKWDWWQIGGRYAGLLPIKTQLPEDHLKVAAYYLWTDAGSPVTDGVEFYYKAEKELLKVYADNVLRGEPSLLMDNFQYEENYGDVAALKNIDFEKISSDCLKERELFYSRYLRYKELKSNPNLEKDKDDVWLNYDIQTKLRSIGAIKEVPKEHNYPENQEITPEIFEPKFEEQELTLEIINSQYKWAWEFSTYAVIETNGNWFQKGEMGWWGLSSDNVEDRINWGHSFFDNFIKNEDPETLLVIVDCHI